MSSFRYAEQGDFEAVNQLARQAHEMHVAWRPEFFRQVEYPFEQSVFQRRTEEKQILLACEGDIILAYAAYDIRKIELPMLCPGRVLTLDNLCVAENCRRSGIATKLIEYLCSLAKEWGCTDFQLNCYPENAAGIALYESLDMRVKVVQYHKKL